MDAGLARRSRGEIERHFRIGVVGVRLRTAYRKLLDDYTSLYGRWQTVEPADRSIAVTVRKRRTAPWKRCRWEVVGNSTLRFEPALDAEVLPYVEWAVNWEVPRLMPEYLQLHASSLEVDGAGVIFPGASGSGKSTLTVGLLTRGWRYLCDEFALIHAERLELDPYPRGICIKKPAFPVLRALAVEPHGKRQYIKGIKGSVGFVDPLSIAATSIGRCCPIRFVIFPKYRAGAAPRLEEMGRGEAAFALHEVCFNLHGCQALGLDVIAAMIRGAACFRLTSGAIGPTCDLLEELVLGRKSTARAGMVASSAREGEPARTLRTADTNA